MKVFYYFVILLICLRAEATPLAQSKQQDRAAKQISLLAFSDLHFDPYQYCKKRRPCPLIQYLQSQPVSQWEKILQDYPIETVNYFKNTNQRLFAEFLQNAKLQVGRNHPDFIIFLGDFLGHNFRRQFKKYAKNSSQIAYQNFVVKTLKFIYLELQSVFPDTAIYPVLGNNDTFYGDYNLHNNALFLNKITPWAASGVNDKSIRQHFINQFIEKGYYSVKPIQSKNIKLIALNTNLFSRKSRGYQVDNLAEQELNWLKKTLQEAEQKHEKVIIMMHIPPAVDIYLHYRIFLYRLLLLWKSQYVSDFESLLAQFQQHILGVFVGHLHSSWYHALVLNENKAVVPMIGVSSISPIFGNLPAYQLSSYSESENIWHSQEYRYPF